MDGVYSAPNQRDWEHLAGGRKSPGAIIKGVRGQTRRDGPEGLEAHGDPSTNDYGFAYAYNKCRVRPETLAERVILA